MSAAQVGTSKKLIRGSRKGSLALAALVSSMAVLGLFFPTSQDGVTSASLRYVFSGMCFVALSTVFLVSHGGRLSIVNSILINVIVLVATVLSPLRDLAYGLFALYGLASLGLALNLRTIRGGSVVRATFVLLNAVNVVLSVAVLARVPAVGDWFVRNYSAFYYGLEYNAIVYSVSPVLTHGSHAIAAFFYYLFFFLAFRAFARGWGWHYLALAVADVVLCLALRSVAGTVLGAVACIQLGWYFAARSQPGRWRAILVAAMGAFLLVSLAVRPDLWAAAYQLFDSRVNGFNARYATDAPPFKLIQYVAENPLHPIGVARVPGLAIVDSGPIEHAIRGSVLLVLAIYGGLWLYLRNNLVRRADAVALFAALIAFEFAFNNLLYIRTIWVLPFLVVFLNEVAAGAPEQPMALLKAPPRWSVFRRRAAETNSRQDEPGSV